MDFILRGVKLEKHYGLRGTKPRNVNSTVLPVISEIMDMIFTLTIKSKGVSKFNYPMLESIVKWDAIGSRTASLQF